MIRPHDVIFTAMIIGAITGYGIAKSGLDDKFFDALDKASDRRALRNAQIMLDEAAYRDFGVIIPAKAQDASKG